MGKCYAISHRPRSSQHHLGDVLAIDNSFMFAQPRWLPIIDDVEFFMPGVFMAMMYSLRVGTSFGRKNVSKFYPSFCLTHSAPLQFCDS